MKAGSKGRKEEEARKGGMEGRKVREGRMEGRKEGRMGSGSTTVLYHGVTVGYNLWQKSGNLRQDTQNPT